MRVYSSTICYTVPLMPPPTYKTNVLPAKQAKIELLQIRETHETNFCNGGWNALGLSHNSQITLRAADVAVLAVVVAVLAVDVAVLAVDVAVLAVDVCLC